VPISILMKIFEMAARMRMSVYIGAVWLFLFNRPTSALHLIDRLLA
jgi:hypothetical protein